MFKVLMISAFGTEFLDNVLCHLGFLLIPGTLMKAIQNAYQYFFLSSLLLLAL